MQALRVCKVILGGVEIFFSLIVKYLFSAYWGEIQLALKLVVSLIFYLGHSRHFKML